MSGRILVADDSDVALSAVEDLLHVEGFTVRTVARAIEVLAAVGSFRPDAILLDVRMPDVDGFTLCARIRQDPDTADIPILFMTADDDDQRVIRGFEVGASDFVSKGVHPKILVQRLRNAVEACRAMRRLEELSQAQAQTSHTLATALVEGLVSHKISGFALLASGLAHEINNPLAVSISEVAFARAPDATAAERDEALTSAGEGLQRIADIVRRMQLLGADSSVKGMATLDEVVGAVALPVAEVLARRSIRLDLRLEPTKAVPGGGRLAPVVTELIHNGARHSKDGGLIDLRTWQEDDESVLSIIDHGAGMAPEVRARVFSPFFTTKSDWRALGLGLPMCQHVVTGLGGSMKLDSAEGVGTSVVIRVPNYRPA